MLKSDLSSTMPMLLIADDHRLFVDGLRLIIDHATTYQLAGVVHNGLEVLPFLQRQPIDVLLLDIDLPDRSGQEVAVEVRGKFPEVKILIVSMLNDYHTVKTTLDLGVVGYCLKTAGKDELLRALASVCEGEQYISPELLPVLLNGQRVVAKKPKDPLYNLTEREKTVFVALSQGKSIAAIADEMYVSKHTVESHRKSIYAKLDLHSIGELMRFVRENNLL